MILQGTIMVKTDGFSVELDNGLGQETLTLKFMRMFTYYDKTKYVCKQVIYIDKHAQS